MMPDLSEKEPLSASDRRAVYEAAASYLPPVSLAGRVWTEREVDVLRKACAVRFDENVRTETLFTIAAAAMRIAKSWDAQ